MRLRVKQQYRPIGYRLRLKVGSAGPVLDLDAEWRDITEPSEDGMSWRIRQREGHAAPVSFRVSVTGRTLAAVWGDGEPEAEALKCAMLMAIRDEVAVVQQQGAALEPDHPVSVSHKHLEEGIRMANAPSEPGIS